MLKYPGSSKNEGHSFSLAQVTQNQKSTQHLLPPFWHSFLCHFVRTGGCENILLEVLDYNCLRISIFIHNKVTAVRIKWITLHTRGQQKRKILSNVLRFCRVHLCLWRDQFGYCGTRELPGALVNISNR